MNNYTYEVATTERASAANGIVSVRAEDSIGVVHMLKASLDRPQAQSALRYAPCGTVFVVMGEPNLIRGGIREITVDAIARREGELKHWKQINSQVLIDAGYTQVHTNGNSSYWQVPTSSVLELRHGYTQIVDGFTR